VGVWKYVTVVFDGSQSTDATKLKIYLNGAPATVNYDLTMPTSIPTPPTAFSATFGTIVNLNSFMNGALDDVRIYNRALSATEVAKLYNLGR